MTLDTQVKCARLEEGRGCSAQGREGRVSVCKASKDFSAKVERSWNPPVWLESQVPQDGRLNQEAGNRGRGAREQSRSLGTLASF